MQVLIVHCHPDPSSFNGAMTRITRECLASTGHVVALSDLYAQGFDPVEHSRHYEAPTNSAVFQPLTEQRYAFESEQLAPDVRREVDKLKAADLVIFQFPLWWHGMPAMLKGWFDRVFVYGGIYNGERRFDRGMLQGKRALYSFTTGGPAETFSPLGRSGDIAKLIWPLHCSLYYVGFDVLPPHSIYGVQGGGLQYQAADAFRKRLEEEKQRWKDRLTGLFEEMPIPFTGWSD